MGKQTKKCELRAKLGEWAAPPGPCFGGLLSNHGVHQTRTLWCGVPLTHEGGSFCLSHQHFTGRVRLLHAAAGPRGTDGTPEDQFLSRHLAPSPGVPHVRSLESRPLLCFTRGGRPTVTVPRKIIHVLLGAGRMGPGYKSPTPTALSSGPSPARPSKPAPSHCHRTRCARPSRGGGERGGAQLSMRRGRLAGPLYDPPHPRPAPPRPAPPALLCEPRREVAHAPFSPPCGSRAPGVFGVWRPCVMTYTRAKTWGRRRAVESVSFRVCLAPLASLVLPGVASPFPRVVAPGWERVPGASSRRFPRAGPGSGAGGGSGWRRASAFWAPWASPRGGRVLPAASLPSQPGWGWGGRVPSSAPCLILVMTALARMCSEDGWAGLCGGF